MRKKYSYIIKVLKESVENETVSLNDFLFEKEKSEENPKTDLDDIFNYTDSESSLKLAQKKYDTHIICKCGHCFKDKTALSIFQSNENIKLFDNIQDIKCPKCDSKIDLLNSIKLENSYSYQNVISKRYHFFKEFNKVRIVLFIKNIQYNKKGKLFVENFRKSITFHIKEKRFFYSESKVNSKDKIVFAFSNKKFIDVFYSFFDLNAYENVCYFSKNKQKIFKNPKNDIIEPLKSFVNELISHLEAKDVNRILDIINLDDSIFDIKNIENEDYYSKKENYIHALSIICSILQYPYNSNILFLKGIEFYLKMLKNKYLSNKEYLKKYHPTSPINIMINSIKDDRRSYFKYYQKLLKHSLKNNYPNIILNEKNLKFIKKDIQKQNFADEYSKRNFDIYINNLEELKEKLKKEAYISKSSFNKIKNADDMMIFISISEHIDKDKIHYISNKFDLNYFIPIFKVLTHSFESHYISEKAFCNFEFTIKKIKYIINFIKKNKIKINDFPYGVFIDTFRFYESFYGDKKEEYIKEIFYCKNLNQLNNLHDNIYKKILLKKNVENDQKIKDFCKQYEHIKINLIENVSFTLIDNLEDLLEEGAFMKHCVGTYASRLADGKHLIFSVKDESTEERATLEFFLGEEEFFSPINNLKAKDEKVWYFNQLKSKYNEKASNNIIEKFKLFCEKLEKSGLKIFVNKNAYDLIKNKKKDEKY